LEIGNLFFEDRPQVKHSRLRVRQGDAASVRRRVGRRREECELTTGSDACDCCRKGGIHIVHRTQGDYVEALGGGHSLYAVGPDLGGEGEVANDLTEECSFFVLGFGESDLNVRTEKGDGKAGEASSGSEVEEGAGVWVEVTGGEEAFSEVATDNFLGVADGGEVGTGVPLEEKIEVNGELRKEGGGNFGQIGSEEGTYGGV
jgi:hypothetical protein